MLIGRRDENGKVSFERVPDLPCDYTCAEWKAYDAACDAAGGVDLDSEEQRRTYKAYHDKMQARYDAGDTEDIYDPNDAEEEWEPEEDTSEQRGGFLGWLFGR